MSEATISDMLKDEVKAEAEPVAAATEQAQAEGEGINWVEILKRESPDKPIETYKEHPLNFNSAPCTGQVIRGFEGLLGEGLKYAILDIVIGTIRCIVGAVQKKKEAEGS